MTDEYSNVPDLYVAAQEDISINGKLYTKLICMGDWGRMDKNKIMGDSIAAGFDFGTDTVQEIIEGNTYDAMLMADMTAEVNDDDADGTEDSKVPGLKYEVWVSKRKVIQDSVELTTNLAKLRGDELFLVADTTGEQQRLTGTLDGELTAGETVTGSSSGATGKFVYQNVASGAGYIVIESINGTWETSEDAEGASYKCGSITSIDDEHYLYELDGTNTHNIYEHHRIQSLLQANRVICVDKLPDNSETKHTYSGTVNDTDDQAIFGVVTYVFEDPSVTSNEEAEASATAMLTHFQSDAFGGYIKAPMNCGQEMHDIVKVTDSRGGWTGDDVIEGRVGGIIREFKAWEGVYTIELTIGGLWVPPPPLDLPAPTPTPPPVTWDKPPHPWPGETDTTKPTPTKTDDHLRQQLPPVVPPPETFTPYSRREYEEAWKYRPVETLEMAPLPEGIPGFGEAPLEAPVMIPPEGVELGRVRIPRGIQISEELAQSIEAQKAYEAVRGVEPYAGMVRQPKTRWQAWQYAATTLLGMTTMLAGLFMPALAPSLAQLTARVATVGGITAGATVGVSAQEAVTPLAPSPEQVTAETFSGDEWWRGGSLW